MKIRFKWGVERKQISWEEVDDESEAVLPLERLFQHRYAVVGSWNSSRPVDLERTSDGWDGTFQLGFRGKEDFQLWRDFDPKQALYPAKHRCTSSSVPVRGPDAFGKGKNWQVRGHPGDVVKIRLEIAGRIRLTVSVRECETVFTSGPESYSLLGTFSNWSAVNMIEDTLGVFRSVITVGDNFVPQLGCFTEVFQVVMDEDPHCAFYPEVADSPSGTNIVRGPDDEGDGKHFLIQSEEAGISVEIVLDLNVEDRRQRVSWSAV